MKLYTVNVVAAFLDLSPRRVRQLRDEGVIAEASPGLYNLQETNRRYIRYLRNQNAGDGGAADYGEERALYMRAKRKREEYELAQEERTLHQAEDIKAVLVKMLLVFKSKLLSLPSKLAPVLAQKTSKVEIHELLKQAMEETLHELADYDALFGDLEGQENEADDG